MATKTYRARIINADRRLQAALDRTHYVFVHCLRQMIELYLAMRKGRCGPECQAYVNVLLEKPNQAAHGLMDQITRPVVSSGLDADWVELARQVHVAHGGPLFLQHEGFARVDGITVHTKSHGKVQPVRGRLAAPAKFWHQVCDSASAFLRSNGELMDQWRAERANWLEAKAKWEADNPDFMAFWTGPYADFEKACEEQRERSQAQAGQAVVPKKRDSRTRGRRVQRWHLWYEWVASHPEIVAWRKRAQPEEFRPVPPDVQSQIRQRHPRQDKHIPKFLDWLKENNPEFAALDKLRRQYVRNFLRFKRPPTLTLPSPDRHPYWFNMELDQFYRRVDFDSGLIQVQLIDQTSEGAWVFRWFDATITCDPRLKPSFRTQTFSREGRYPPYVGKKIGRTLDRPATTPPDRKAGIRGAKLVIRGSRTELLFTVIEQDCPPRTVWRKVKNRTCPADNACRPDGQEGPLTVLAVDLGIRHIGAYAIAQATKDATWTLSWLKKGIVQDASAPPLRAIRAHDLQLRRRRRQRGRAVRGELSCVGLQAHRTHMADDRFKKGANAIVELARTHHADLILFENLERLSPTAFDERWANRQLRDMNRRRIVEAVQQQAEEFGIITKDDISPYLTSQLCSRCFKPGWRFSIKPKVPYNEQASRRDCTDYGYPLWDPGGHLFRCPHCGYRANADVNAAGNIAARFFGLLPDVQRKDGVYTWPGGGPFDAKASFAAWAAEARRRKQLGETPF